MVITWRILYSCFSVGSFRCPSYGVGSRVRHAFYTREIARRIRGTFQYERQGWECAVLLLRARLGGKQGARRWWFANKKMADLHLEVLEMMERVRANMKFQDFYYGVRVRESPTSRLLRVREGYIPGKTTIRLTKLYAQI